MIEPATYALAPFTHVQESRHNIYVAETQQNAFREERGEGRERKGVRQLSQLHHLCADAAAAAVAAAAESNPESEVDVSL